MGKKVISVEHVSKIYRLGEIGTGTLSSDVNRWWVTKVLGKEDPYLKIGQVNDRSTKGDTDVVYSLKDVSFDVEQGEVLGIIGKNGAGKSTLLKILSRITSPTSGRVLMKGRVASLLEVGTGFHPELTGRENIYLNGSILGMRKHEIARKLDEIIAFSGVERYIDTPVKRYSSGMYVRLAFAVAAHLESEILIVDEVLAVGDAEFQKKCLGKMGEVSRTQGKTILFVSHDLRAISSLCSKVITLEYGCLKNQGNVNEVIGKYLVDNSNQIIQKVTNKGVVFQNIENKSHLVNLPMDDDLDINMFFRIERKLSSVYFDFAITNHLGEIVVHSRNGLSGNPSDLTEGKIIKVNYIVREPRLLPGEYFLTIYVFSENLTGVDEVYLWLESIPLLTVAGVNADSNQKLFDMVAGIRSKVLHHSNIIIH